MFNKKIEGVGKFGERRWKQQNNYFAFNGSKCDDTEE